MRRSQVETFVTIPSSISRAARRAICPWLAKAQRDIFGQTLGGRFRLSFEQPKFLFLEVHVRASTDLRLRRVILASAIALCACSDSVGPGIPKGKTHPAGVVAATVAIGARPYGIGLFGTTGVVTQLDA